MRLAVKRHDPPERRPPVPPATARKQMKKTMKMTSIRDLSADELGAVWEVRRASPVNVPKNAFDKLLAAIDKKIFVPM